MGTHQTHLSPPPRCSQGTFSTFTWHRWRLELENIFPTGSWEDTQREKVPKRAPGMAKGGGRGKKLLLLVSDLNVPEPMARQGHCLPCAAVKTMLESSNSTAAFHSICSWKLLQFSLPLLVSCHSRSPARSPLLWLDLSPRVSVANVRIIPSDKVSARPRLPCLLASLSRPFPHV